MTEARQAYDIETDTVLFAGAEHFDIDAVARAQTPWWNRTLCTVNDTLVRLGVLDGILAGLPRKGPGRSDDVRRHPSEDALHRRACLKGGCSPPYRANQGRADSKLHTVQRRGPPDHHAALVRLDE